MFFTYILQSKIDRSYYIGHSSDIIKRLEYHNQGLSKYTSKKMPWKLVYLETFETKKEANRREMFLKKQRNHSFYERLISSNSNKINHLEEL
jgi:putative endonuclease